MQVRRVIFLFFFISSCAFVRPTVGTKPYSSKEIKNLYAKIEEILTDSLLKPATCGICAVSLGTGQVIYERNSHKLLLPASNMKLITSLAALYLLGPSYKFETHFYIDSTETLYIKGFGDPTLSYEDLLIIAERFKAKGLKSLEKIVVDNYFFDSLEMGPGWMWDEGSYPYAARISALSLNENIIEIWVNTAENVGDIVKVNLIPPTRCVELKVEAITLPADSVSKIEVNRVFDAKNKIIVKGGLPIFSSPKVFYRNLENPPLYTGGVFKEILEREGISVKNGILRGSVPKSAELFYIHKSPPLSEIIRKLNKFSSNFIAEQILKTLGAIFLNPPGTWEKGEEVIKEFLQDMGLDTISIRMVDGSGLSRYNLLSANQIVSVLIKAAKDFSISPEFFSSLPIGGVDGTLLLRMQDTLLLGKVRAKTGTLWGVSSLSGYVATKNNDIIAFSILMNNFLGSVDDIRKIQDKIVRILAEFPKE